MEPLDARLFSPHSLDVFLWQVHLSPKREETKEGGVSARASCLWPSPTSSVFSQLGLLSLPRRQSHASTGD